MKPLLVIALFLPFAQIAGAADITLTIHEHRFEPTEITIPAGQKVKIILINKDSTAEEFEIYDLNREKVVAGNGTSSIYIGPLKPGRYPFMGEFHEDTAQGVIIAQ